MNDERKWVIRKGYEKGAGEYLWSMYGHGDYGLGHHAQKAGKWGRYAGALTYGSRRQAIRDAADLISARVVRVRPRTSVSESEPR